ncbi:cupin domain-containing protein [Chelatococcus sp. GCM10030263]|uniref:cupin domain-containing protein n=1 Tax=Chelatococcus sp. GCM10030263 TaxID=3273387 RepID=UPI00361774D6
MEFSFWRSRGDEPSVLIPAIGLELNVLLPPASNQNAMTVIETVNAPGFGPPRHRHPETEVFRVMEGRYLYEVDGRRFFADAGDLVSVPGGAVHGFVNVTDRPARQLIMILPGLDAKCFFTELGEIMRHGIPDRARLNEFGARWNIEFLGPPVRAADGITER